MSRGQALVTSATADAWSMPVHITSEASGPRATACCLLCVVRPLSADLNVHQHPAGATVVSLRIVRRNMVMRRSDTTFAFFTLA